MRNERTPALFIHLSAFAVFLSIPFGNIIGPLVLWLIFRDKSEFLDNTGKEAVNFQISMTIYFVISGILIFILVGILLLLVAIILWFVFVIIATVHANNGERYYYPFTIHFIA